MSLTFYPKSHRYKMSTAAGELAWVQGVTTLIGGGIPKGGLPHWYAEQAARFVLENPLEVERLRGEPDVIRRRGPVPKLIDRLCEEPRIQRDKAADRGTELHNLAEQLLNGEEVEIPPEHSLEVHGLVEFMDRLDLTPLLAEVSVGNRTHWYAGRADFIGTSPHLNNGEPFILDWKSSKSIHGDTALQLAAYARAEFYVTDDDPDTERALPEVTASYVAHVTMGGTFLHDGFPQNPAEIGTAFEMFKCAAYTTKTAKRRDQYAESVMDLDTITNPSNTQQKAA